MAAKKRGQTNSPVERLLTAILRKSVLKERIPDLLKGHDESEGERRPALVFFVKDWQTDPQLRQASPATRGIWMDILCSMHYAPIYGVLEGREDRICRLIGCTNDEFLAFKEENSLLKFCEFREISMREKVLIASRRMVRDEAKRIAKKLQKRAERA